MSKKFFQFKDYTDEVFIMREIKISKNIFIIVDLPPKDGIRIFKSKMTVL